MTKITTLFFTLMIALSALGQSQKLKGSRNVTTDRREIGNFVNIEVEDNVEVFLVKGDQCGVDIEADDNLHQAISISLNGETLRISASADVTSSKKFSVKITHNANLAMLIAKDDANITSLTDMNLADFTIKTSGSARIYATVKAKTFTLMANDKSRIEMNLNADNATVELSKNTQMKALVSSPKLKFDMYQKALATIEGDVLDLKLRLSNNTNFTGKNLTVKNAEMITEDSVNCSLAVTGNATIDASGKSEIELHGEQTKIEIRKFTGNSSIRKRASKVVN